MSPSPIGADSHRYRLAFFMSVDGPHWVDAGGVVSPTAASSEDGGAITTWARGKATAPQATRGNVHSGVSGVLRPRAIASGQPAGCHSYTGDVETQAGPAAGWAAGSRRCARRGRKPGHPSARSPAGRRATVFNSAPIGRYVSVTDRVAYQTSRRPGCTAPPVAGPPTVKRLSARNEPRLASCHGI